MSDLCQEDMADLTCAEKKPVKRKSDIGHVMSAGTHRGHRKTTGVSYES